MLEKEIGEIRRRIRTGKNNITAIYGCYVNDSQEIIAKFRLPVSMMPENEQEKYFSLLKRSLSGVPGKNLIDISFQTSQVVDSPEHKLLMGLRNTALKDEALLDQLYEKITSSLTLDTGYLILVCCDSYDVPFKSKDDAMQADAGEETYTYLLCGICPVKLAKSTLRYVSEEQVFHDGGAVNQATAPVLGFLFPAFDNRSTNIYNALYYTRDLTDSHQPLVDALFNTGIPKPAAEQKKSFEAILGNALEQECSMDVVQTVHDELRQRMALHKESKVPEPLLVDKEDVQGVLRGCGISEAHLAKFSVDFEQEFGTNALIPPRNVIDSKRFEVKTPDVVIKVNPERSDLIETRVIGGVKYILIAADDSVEVNGVNITIQE